MFGTSQNIQILAFFLLAGFFELLERMRPAREYDRWKDLKTNVFSFALAIVLNQTCSYVTDGFFSRYTPAYIIAACHSLRSLPGAVKIGIALVMIDFCLYWIHRSQHEFDSLWKTHRWHHSSEQLYWFSGFRTSFSQSFLYNIPQAGIPMVIFNLNPMQAGIGYSIGLLIQFWEHTNFDVNIGPLKYIFITPAFHRVHHSASDICRKNLGTTFSFWDRMFGTYINPDTVPKDTPLGLGETIEKEKLPRLIIGV
jgi:sterol desaturase/sphingolipid hydroxylase (fatty acid hydroxylase superfamily)